MSNEWRMGRIGRVGRRDVSAVFARTSGGRGKGCELRMKEDPLNTPESPDRMIERKVWYNALLSLVCEQSKSTYSIDRLRR